MNLKVVKMKKKLKREFVEWGILVLVVSVIYLGGWHTEVLGRLQQVVLSTGVLSPNELAHKKVASLDFFLEDADGNAVAFKEQEGNVIFLNFWATWCPPCIAEMPDINDLYNKKNNEASFFLVSVDKDRQKAIDFVKRKQFDFPIYFLNSSLPSDFDIHSIPTTYLIDKQNNITVENHGMAKYDTEKFRNLISRLTKAQ